MDTRKNTFPQKRFGSHKNATSQNAPHKKVYCRSAHRANVIKQVTASKKSAIAFLAKAGILDKSGELTSLYQ